MTANYSCIVDPLDVHKKLICQQTGRVMKIDHRRQGLGEENPDLSRLFCLGVVFKVILNNFKSNALTKIVRTELDSPRRIL